MQMRFGCPAAIACLRGNEGVRGVVRFYPQEDGTLVVAEVFGLKDGFHGFHVHNMGDCGNTGGHYTSQSQEHPNHDGDLPSLLSCGGRARLTVWTGRFSVRDVVGRSVVVHSGRDDFSTQPAGDSGRMVACGVIERC